MDKEYILLNEIEKNENITQRELSKKVELSLGSVNLLINKMVHEGLIKISQIPMNRVAYMLTPAGIAEKVRKTSDYIKIHYNYINETVKKIKSAIIDLNKENNDIIVVLEQDEISELVRQAVNEINNQHIKMVFENHYVADIKKNKDSFYITLSAKKHGELINKGFKALYLMELL